MDTQTRTVLENLVQAVDSALDAGLYRSVDGKRPEVPALAEAKKLLAKPARKLRFRLTDEPGNVYTLWRSEKGWHLTNYQGTPVGWTHICRRGQETPMILDDAGEDPARVQPVLQRIVDRGITVELI